MAERTFADLPDSLVNGPRCNGCGMPLVDAVRLQMHVARHPQPKGTDGWLYRRAAVVCEPCAVTAIEAAIDALAKTGKQAS